MNTQENLQKQEINLKPNSIINSISQENKKKNLFGFLILIVPLKV